LSPKCPNSIAPTGLEMKPALKVKSESIIPDAGFDDGKKIEDQTNVDAVAAILKSYHSIVVPITPAVATLITSLLP